MHARTRARATQQVQLQPLRINSSQLSLASRFVAQQHRYIQEQLGQQQQQLAQQQPHHDQQQQRPRPTAQMIEDAFRRVESRQDFKQELQAAR
jgi:hypothetical protein